jgi:hypothetical protein
LEAACWLTDGRSSIRALTRNKPVLSVTPCSVLLVTGQEPTADQCKRQGLLCTSSCHVRLRGKSLYP